MAGVRNLTQAEAAERARLLDVTSYDISLDLASAGQGDARTFRSTTTVVFSCTEPGATTFVELAAASVRSATLNGAPVDISGWAADKGLTITGLAVTNELVVDADFAYSTSGQGLHRSVDPVDGETYLYSQFETADAQRVYAAFDQPDLKSVYTWHAIVPAHWRVISNMPVSEVDEAGETKTVHFARSERMSTYITALCAGPYHEVRFAHDGIDLGYFCRASMATYFDADALNLITTQGFDFYHAQFGVRYPLPKYDQLWVPDFNAGAMENFGCVTHAESAYVYRSQVTDFEYEQRANTILHELAHMWFGDLVTMRWWNDLWLNESFAEWASHWCNTNATRFTDAWTTFLSIRKNWGYRQDQLSSTHPVYCEMPDLEAVEVNFDGITYAKGASVIKQLVAYVGIEPFLAGLRAYFGRHAWGNATFDDLLGELEAASGRELRKFAAQWLETAQVNTLRPQVAIDASGAYESVVVLQEAPAGYPTLRTHRIGVGLYDLTAEGKLVRRELLEIDVTGERTAVPQLTGVRAPDVLLLNDDDLTYAKLRLDERSMATVVQHIDGFESSLARALCWAAAWDMLRDGRGRHQPGHGDAAPGGGRAVLLRRPRVGADRLDPARRHGPHRDARGCARERLPARLGPRVRVGGPLRRAPGGAARLAGRRQRPRRPADRHGVPLVAAARPGRQRRGVGRGDRRGAGPRPHVERRTRGGGDPRPDPDGGEQGRGVAPAHGVQGVAELAQPGAVVGLPAPGPGRADGTVRDTLLRVGGRGLVDARQRAGTGVRRVRVPDVHDRH
ncbi:hypothetical protein GCM10009687_75700 [Asanoa iriomotensis]